MIKWNDELKNRANIYINSPIVRNNEKKVNGYQIMVLIFFFFNLYINVIETCINAE